MVMIFEYERNTITYQPTIIHRHCEVKNFLKLVPKLYLGTHLFSKFYFAAMVERRNTSA